MALLCIHLLSCVVCLCEQTVYDMLGDDKSLHDLRDADVLHAHRLHPEPLQHLTRVSQ